MTIAELIDLLKLLPGECPSPDELGLFGMSWCKRDEYDYAYLWASLGTTGICCCKLPNELRIDGSIHDPDFRAKFCAFLKEHFA